MDQVALTAPEAKRVQCNKSDVVLKVTLVVLALACVSSLSFAVVAYLKVESLEEQFYQLAMEQAAPSRVSRSEWSSDSMEDLQVAVKALQKQFKAFRQMRGLKGDAMEGLTRCGCHNAL